MSVTAVLLIVYLLQVHTPFRIHPDNVVMFVSAESAVQGRGFLFHGAPTVFPPAYPGLMALLIRFGLARVCLLVAVNLLFLVIGLMALGRALRPAVLSGEGSVRMVCIFTLLSFVMIKHIPIPLTDICFFGISLCAIAAMNAASSRLTPWNVILSVVLVLASIFTRRIGIALIPPLLWVAVTAPGVRRSFLRLSPAVRTLGFCTAVLLCAGVAWSISATSTLRDFHLVMGGNTGWRAAAGIARFRLTELGEMSLNLPASALPVQFQKWLPLLGTAAAVMVLGGLLPGWRRFSVPDVYFISYLAILTVWPFYDPRFWLPVFPFLIAYSKRAWGALIRRGGGPSTGLLSAGYGAVYVTAGVLALYSNTTMSYAGQRFGDFYPSGRPIYCAAGLCTGEYDPAGVDADGLHVLRTLK